MKNMKNGKSKLSFSLIILQKSGFLFFFLSSDFASCVGHCNSDLLSSFYDFCSGLMLNSRLL